MYPSNGSFLVSFCCFYPLNCCSSLPVKICKKTSIGLPRQFSQNFSANLLYTLTGDFYSSLHLNFLYLFVYIRSNQRGRHCNSSGVISFYFYGALFPLNFLSSLRVQICKKQAFLDLLLFSCQLRCILYIGILCMTP